MDSQAISMPESHFDSSAELLLAKKKLQQNNLTQKEKDEILGNIYARKICQDLSYDETKKELKRKNLLKREMKRVKETYKDKLSFFSFLGKKDWTLLTIMELFDNKTMIHSIGTCLTMKDKMERPLDDGSTFSELIRSEGFTLEEFYRACIFHDIGKIAIPKFVLNSHFTDEHWAQAFIQMPKLKREKLGEKNNFEIPQEIRKDPEKIMDFMIRNRIRGARMVPIRALFSKEQISMIKNKKLSPDDSLVKMMEIHEEESEKILKLEGFEKEAVLAGSHHNYKMSNGYAEGCEKHLKSADLIHVADIQNALENDRPYHMRKPKMKILAFIMDDAKAGTINKKTAALWIKDELTRCNRGTLDRIINHTADDINFEYFEDRKKEFEEISNFLQEVLA